MHHFASCPSQAFPVAGMIVLDTTEVGNIHVNAHEPQLGPIHVGLR
jgi:hypothetical protein